MIQISGFSELDTIKLQLYLISSNHFIGDLSKFFMLVDIILGSILDILQKIYFVALNLKFEFSLNREWSTMKIIYACKLHRLCN